jgi:regulator of replication initiation timing
LIVGCYYIIGGKTAPTPDRIQQMEEALKKLYAQREDLKLNLEDIVNFETLLRKDLEIAEVEHTLGSE